MANDLENMTIAQLREEAKSKGIKGYSVLKKAELVAALSLEAKANEPAKEEAPRKKPVGRPRKDAAAAPAAKAPGLVREAAAPARQNAAATPGRAPQDPAARPLREAPERRAIRPGSAPARPAYAEGPGTAPVRPAPARPVMPAPARPTAEPTVPARPAPAETNPSDEFLETGDIQSQLQPDIGALDSGLVKTGILEVMADGYGFIRCDNFLPGTDDVYLSPSQIRKFNLKTGDIVTGNMKVKSPGEKYQALLYIKTVNGLHPSQAQMRPKFENLTPIFPNKRIHLETPGCSPAMRIVDIISPIGKGQRGMIVSQPKAGKTTLLKQIARSICLNHPEMHLIILLIDERPEEVTDMKDSIKGENVEIIYSTFDEKPENHMRVSEMVIEHAKRLVEHKKDVVILLDSITRLARAYNLTVTASGRTLSGGLDPAALYMPKKFFGAARNMKEGGSLTILATALVETGSRMDDVVFEEFKGTGNMELVLDRNLSERRIFPAIDLPRSSTRREDLLLAPYEMEASNLMRRAFNSSRPEESVERIIALFSQTRRNTEFCEILKKTKIIF